MPLDRKPLASMKLHLALGAAVLALLISCVISDQALVFSRDSQRWLRHSNEVLDSLEDSLLAMKSIEASFQGFALTGEEFRLDPYRLNLLILKSRAANLRRLTVDNPLQQMQTPELERLKAQEIQFAETVIAVRRAKGSEAAAEVLRKTEGERVSERFDELVHGLQDNERRLLKIRTVDVKRRLKNSELTMIMVTSLGFLITAAAFWSVRRESASRGLAESALLDSETKYRGLLEAAPDAMVVVDHASEIVLLNLQAEKQFGYRRDELIGQKVTNIIPDGFAERVIADGSRTTAEALEQQIGTGIELSGQRKDGSIFPIEIMLSPLEISRAVLVTAAIRNITARKDAEKHLLEVEAEYSGERERSRDAREEKARLQMAALEQSRQEKLILQERFLSHVSHELRTPLTAIYFFTTNLLDGLLGDLTPKQHEHLSHALNNISQLRDMVSDLLDITRVDGHKVALDSRCESPSELIAGVLATCGAVAGAKNISLRSDTAPSLPFIWVDAARVRQILINLIDNAIKFTPADGAVTVECHGSPTQEGFLHFSVSDTGRGISPENLDIVFDRLAQVEGPGDLSRTGLGLGLFIARELVSLHGGRIWVESQLGHGSSFCFTLPVFSAWKMCSHIFSEPNLSQGFVSLIAVVMSPLAGTTQGDLLSEVRKILSTCIHPALDMLWPAVDEAEQVKTFFIVTCTDANGCAIIGRRIERALQDVEKISRLERAITSTTLLIPMDPSTEGRAGKLFRQINQLIQTQLKEREKIHA